MFSHKHFNLQNIPPSTAFLFAISFFTIFFLISNYSKHLLLDNSSYSKSRFTLITATRTTTTTTTTISQYRAKEVLDASSSATQVLRTADWIRTQPINNFTQNYIKLISENGTKPCHKVSTASARLLGLDQSRNSSTLSCGPKHELTIVSFDENGRRRCQGGDYYEVVLIGPNWRARAPITDLGDGSYSILLQVHPKFAGVYNLKAILTFSNYHGLHRRPERWFRNETVIDTQIEFWNTKSEEGLINPTTVPLLRLKQCEVDDFGLDAWAGRWIRTKYKRTCPIDRFGRFRCMDAGERCDEPWCKGPIGSLESNGWVYSAHCSFRIFTTQNAWRCLDKKWLFFWGDSNHVDTVRNFLNFVLGFENITAVLRRFDTTYFNPYNPSQYVRITSMFNGHSNVSLNHEGLFSLHNDAYRNQLKAFFSDPNIGPDVIVMNSGLHDGMYWKHLHHFVEQGVNEATMFWEGMINGLKNKPRVIYRNTITTAGWARGAAFNPQKMDVFNKMFVERLRAANLIWGVVDGFDLTYAWHLDHRCSDGVHYGKPPAKVNWYGEIGHQYFVDLMLAHILMHAICIK